MLSITMKSELLLEIGLLRVRCNDQSVLVEDITVTLTLLSYPIP